MQSIRRVILGGIIGFGLAVSMSACALFEPDIIEAFEMTHVAERALPSHEIPIWVDLEKSTHGQLIVGARLLFFADQRFIREVRTRSTVDGVPGGGTTISRIRGFYSMDGAQVVLTRDPGHPVDDSWSYQRHEGETELLGVEKHYLAPLAVVSVPVTYRRTR